MIAFLHRKMAKHRVYLTLGLVLVLLLTLYEIIPTGGPGLQVLTSYPAKGTKTILYWAPMFTSPDFYLGVGSKIFESCAYSNCYATYNRHERPEDSYDAILFHGKEYQEKESGRPEKRRPEQVYIFVLMESPVHTPEFISDYNSFYNWTMTYRADSDVYRPYGFVQKRKTDYRPPTAEQVQSKKKKIAWFVSNCWTSSQRELLQMELGKHLDIDVYGDCGSLQCPRSSSRECYERIEKEYKFYLSFENSVCEDYVTEKLYNILRRNIVPIVYGGANYSAKAPPKSVINVMDFKSVKSLVEHINYLDRNVTAYLEYFEWKKDYVARNDPETSVLCNLCRQLNEPVTVQVYDNLVEWWRGKNRDKCSNDFVKKFLNVT